MSTANASYRTDGEHVHIATKVHSLINNGKLECLKREFEGLAQSRRREIVLHKIDRKAALFVACEKNHTDIVKYLVEECGADMEQRGHYQHHPFHFEDQVPPLWSAVENNSLEVVKTLQMLGADINCRSSTKGTALLVGCLHNSEDSVRFLVKEGADVNAPNIYGVTPLLNASSKGSLPLCSFLLDNKADVNVTDSSGRTALHRAIEERRLEVVKLLLEKGCDHRKRTETGESVLRMAALKGCESIVEYMVENVSVDVLETVEAYELMGSYHVIETNEYNEGYKYWRKSIELRYKDEGKPMLKENTEQLGTYTEFKEFNSLKELDHFRSLPKEGFNIQALLIRERILGTSHTETVWTLDYCGAVYADTDCFQECINIWKFSYKLLLRKEDAFYEDCIFRIQALMKVFLDLKEYQDKGLTNQKLRIQDLFEVLECLIQNIRLGKTVFVQRPWEQNTPARFRTLMVMSLQLTKLILQLDTTDDENKRFVCLITSLVELNPTDELNRSLLHLSTDNNTSKTDEYSYRKFPCAEVMKVLVDCGADVNQADAIRDTPLLMCARQTTNAEYQPDMVKMIQCLLDNDAHIDICNKFGQNPLKFLKQYGFKFCPLQYQSLRCSAAAVVMQQGIPYRESVPKSLIPFIEVHGKNVVNRFKSE